MNFLSSEFVIITLRIELKLLDIFDNFNEIELFSQPLFAFFYKSPKPLVRTQIGHKTKLVPCTYL